MRALSAFALMAVVFTATGCLAVSQLDHSLTPTPVLEDRSDCGQILGTAFRSDAEQAWFAENCSAWTGTTLGRLADPTPAGGTAVNAGGQQQGGADADGSGGRDGAQVNPQNTDNAVRCNELRGRPYENPADRQWYLANCQGQPQTVAADVRDCNQIRGRPYASEEQRVWFLANCLNQGQTTAGPAQGAQQQGNAGASQGGQGPSDAGPSQNANAGPTNTGQTAQPAIGPAGRPCSEIYGTRYRSGSEQAWFSENC